MESIMDIAIRAKNASKALSVMSAAQKNEILFKMADALEKNASYIIRENKIDLAASQEMGRTDAILDRLMLNEQRIHGMAEGLRKVARLADPVGEIISGGTVASGLTIIKKRVPMGVVGIIYEARPNVTSDSIGLCLKTGNSALLKGGSDAIHSNIAIADVAIEAGKEAGLPEGAVGLIRDTSRTTAEEMMKLNGYIDVLIPRGGAGLIQSVVKNATVPVIETGVGNCHVYVDEWADLAMAVKIVVNAKTSRPSVCNAAESLLVHKNVAKDFLPMVFAALKEKNVEIRGCEISRQYGDIKPATEEDYATEYLDYIISVKVVDSLEEAVSHIDRYGTKHSEAIVTKNIGNARYFQDMVDAAAVYVNASTRFTDGEEFGMGAEIGISTQKLHARGPMALKELTTYKYLVEGNGQIR